MSKIGYVRVSKSEQDPSSQVKLMQDLGMKIEDIYIDAGVSGVIKPEQRPVFKQMLVKINETKDIDEIVFSEFSRIGRNVEDSLMTLLTLKQKGIKITSLSKHESFINELPSDLQPTLLSAMAFAASIERNHTRERTMWGQSVARAKGKKIGRPTVIVDLQKVKDIMNKYHLKEKQAARVCGYCESTFYKYKNRQLKQNKSENK